jgi:hypothetical protein
MEELEDLYNLMVQSKLTKNSFSAFKSEFESSADYRKQMFNTMQWGGGGALASKIKLFPNLFDESKYSKEHGGYGESKEQIKLELDLKPKLFNPATEVTPTATPGHLIGQTPNTPYPFISKVEDAFPGGYYQNQKTSQTYQFREGKYIDLELSKTVDQIEKVINNNLAGAFGKTNYFAEEKITPEINLLIKPYGWTVTEGDGINAVKLQKGDIIQNFDLNDENIAETIANFVANPPKKSAEWNYDKGQFNTYMEKYYTPEMIKRLTSKEYLANVADEDDFLDQIKEDLGYGFFVDNRTNYPNLSDLDIDRLIIDKFYSKKSAEKQKINDTAAAAYLQRLNEPNTSGDNVIKFHFYHRENDIKNIKDENLKGIYTSNNKIYHGDLSEEEIKIELEKTETYKANIKKSGGKYISQYNTITGELVNKVVYKGEQPAEENYESVENEIQNIMQTFGKQPKGTSLDVAESKYNRTNLALAELNLELDRKYNITVPGSKGPQSVSLKELISSYNSVLNEYSGAVLQGTGRQDYISNTGSQVKYTGYQPSAIRLEDLITRTIARQKELLIQKEAWTRIYLGNENAMSMEKSKWADAGKAFVNSIGAIINTELITSPTDTEVLETAVAELEGVGQANAEEINYAKKTFGQQVSTTITGSGGIVLEFYFANKAFAGVRAANLFSGGTKSINSIITAAKAPRYTNSAGVVMTEAQIAAKVAASTRYNTVASWTNRYGFTTKVGANPITYGAAVISEGIIEGAKFSVLPSSRDDRFGSFNHGFGFGLGGQILAPLMGTIKKANVEKYLGTNPYTKVIANNAPRLDKAYGLLIKTPVNFAAGSELGEITLAVTDDFLGGKEISTMMHEHYGDLSATTQRMILNGITGIALGFSHKSSFTGWKSYNGLRTAKNELENKLIEKTPENEFVIRTKDGKELIFTEEQWNSVKNDPTTGYELVSEPGQFRRANISSEKRQEYQDALNLIDFEINKTDNSMDLYNPILAPVLLEKAYKAQNKHYIEKGVKIEVIRADNNTKYFKDNPYAQARVEYIDANGNVSGEFKQGKTVKVRQTFNVDRIEPGVAPHELGHSGTSILFGTNARFKSDFLVKLGNIAKEIPTFGDKTLLDEMIEFNGKWDPLNRKWENDRINDWEMFSYIAEWLAKPGNAKYLEDSNAWQKLDALIEKNIGEELGQTYNFKTHADIVRFFEDYIKTIGKGENSLGVLEHLNVVIDKGSTKTTERLRKLWESEGFDIDNALQSRDLSREKSELINERLRLEKESKEESKAKIKEIDKEIIEIDKNINSSNVNAEQIIKFKGAVAEEKQLIEKLGEKPKNFVNPKKERAVKALKENNEGILNEFVNNNYIDTPGSNLTKREFKLYVENNEFLKLLNSYSTDLKVPFGAYLKTNLEFRLGNILKALGVDMKVQSATSSMSDPKFKDTRDEFVEDAPDFDTQFRNDNIPGGTDGILLVYKLPVKQATIDAISGEVPSIIERIQFGEKVDYGKIEDFTPEATKDMFGKTTKDKATFIVENEKTLYTAMPKSTSGVTGKGTGITNNIYKLFYQKTGEAVKMADTGNKAGNKIQEKLPYRKGILLDAFGIKYNESTREVDVTSMDRNTKVSTLPGFESIIGRAITNQVLGHEIKNSGVQDAQTMFNNVTSGKGPGLASRLLRSFSDKFKIPLEEAQEIFINYAYENRDLIDKKYLNFIDKFDFKGDFSNPYHASLFAAIRVEAAKGKENQVDWKKDFNKYWDNFPEKNLPQVYKDNGITIADLKRINHEGFISVTKTKLRDDGDKYVGEWKGEMYNGQGTYTWANGHKYVGEWVNDIRIGQGTFTWANGDKYVGQWKNDKRTGQGTYTWASGNKYVGGFKDNKQHGQGTYTYANGKKYVGEFKDGKFRGQGTLTLDKSGENITPDKSAKNIVFDINRANTFTDHMVGISELLPPELGDNKSLLQGLLGFHARTTLMGVKVKDVADGQGPSYRENSKGAIEFISGREGESILNQPFIEAFPRVLKSIGTGKISEVWKDITFKFKTAPQQADAARKMKGKTREQQEAIANEYFSGLDNVTKQNILFALEVTKQDYIQGGKNKAEILSRIEAVYNLARMNSNLRLGIRQLVSSGYVQFFPGQSKAQIKLEHAKASVQQSLIMANMEASGTFTKNGKASLADFIALLGDKNLFDKVDKLAGATNTAGLYKMALLSPEVQKTFWNVENGYKTNLFQDIGRRFVEEYGKAEFDKVNKQHIELGKFYDKVIKQSGFSENALQSKNLGEKQELVTAINKALKNGRDRNKKPKGMSTWDFDGTLATTKSGVRATIPNPSGKPKPSRKVIFMAGGAGSGKGNVIKKLDLQGQGFKVVNSDISLEWLKKNNGLPENMNDFTPEQRSLLGSLQNQARGIAKNKMMKYKGNADGVVVDGTGGSIKVMENLVKEFKDNGYDVSMVFVETSLETALARNKARAERSLLDVIVRKNHELVQGNKEGFKEMFGDRFMEIKTDKMTQADAMPAELVSKMKDFVSGYEKVRLDAEQFANDGKSILDAGGKFDFAEFNVVTEGAQGPMFQTALNRAKKFGTKDQFILTARPQEAALPIYEFLKSQGLEIPIKNITGLGNSTGEAKALWMIKKFAEGYNDMYFADDVIQNTSAVKSALDKLQVKSKVVLAKGTQEQQLNNIKNPDKLDSPGVYQGLASRNLRAEYEKTISKLRPDLVKEGSVSRMVDEMFDFIDTLKIPENKKRKYEQITTKWLATGNIRIKEDAFRIKKAMELADRYKEDVFSYRNPNEIIEKYAGKVKVKPTVPKSTKEFTLLSDAPLKERGVEEVMIADSRNGQAQARKIVNRHWGNESNPWCLTQVKDGKLTEDAWTMWTSYDKGPKHLVFQDGKLIAFKADNVYWDRMNHRTEGVIINVKEGRVTHRTELTRESTTKSSGVEVKGAIEPVIRETRTVSEDGNTVKTEIFENSKDGYTEGTVLIENRTKGVRTKETRFDPDGTKASVQEFNKAGKPTTSYEFSPDGKIKSVNGHLQKQAINEAGLDVNAREDVVINLADNLVKKVGDILEKNYTEKDAETGVVTDYFYGRVSLGGKVVEIGFESKSNLDLADVTKTVDGKTRIDINKVLEVDPTLKGLPKDFKPSGTGMQNIKIVKQVLDQLDIKSDVQQGLASKNLNKSFNDIIEQTTKVESEKVFSDAQAKIRGAKKRYDSIIPASVQDLGGLLYNFLGKGKVGEKQMEFFKENLIDPFSKGINELNQSRQATSNDYNNLLKSFPDVKSKLNKSIEGSDFTYDQAIRVHLWNKAGFEIPGLSKRDLNALDSVVKNNPELQAFADLISAISKKEAGYSKPSEHWLVENITSELLSGEAVSQSRSEFLAEWKQNSSEIFSKENLNKIQATYGNKFREALEDILYRMENGTNRPTGSSRLTNNFMNWINNSTGAIMFFNMRSALLQTLSTTNYINWAENNPLKAATAFANQKQYWKDFSELFNSDFLKQRRSGNQRSINEAELSAAVANSDSKPKAALAWLLQKGFLPTQIADSFAISSGGATFYRNRINKYIKEGMSPEQAREKAFLDFQEITEATQQSARPDMISQQQASPLGRLILSFQNTPMQYARIMNKAARDIASGRGDQKSNISKIVYYGALQSIIFGAMQSAIFASLGDDEQEEFDKKKERIMYSMVDGWLAGLGVTGKAVGTIEKSIKEYLKQKDKGFNADHAKTIMQLLGFSPPVGSKVRKIHGSIQTEQFNKGVSEKRGFTLDNPTWSTYGNVVEGFTNVPMGRLANKMLNIDNALDSQNEWWERAALLLGWNTWDLGIKDPDIEAARKEVKQDKKDQKPVKKKYSEMTFEEVEAERERRRKAKELKLQSQ